MMTRFAFCALIAGLGFVSLSDQDGDGWDEPEQREELTFTADRIIGENQSQVLLATGHVHAVSKPLLITGESLRRLDDGTIVFSDPTCATTCTNASGFLHWRVTGEIEYRAYDHVILRNLWLRFFEVPIIWLPYMYYPLDPDCGFSFMPGYAGRWGGFLLTRYRYHLAGDPYCRDYTWWLKGDTRFDLRYRQGLAAGEDLSWNLGDFGSGRFGIYYAWDQDANKRYNDRQEYAWRYDGYGSEVDSRRYAMSFAHRYEPTEQDVLWVQGSLYSDTYMKSDFFRNSMFNFQNDWQSYESSGVFWDHIENSLAFGAEVSGRLNKFYEAVGRLPEVYFDVNPQPVFGSPVNYESQTRVGYLRRDPAEYGSGRRTVYTFNPGPWAEYDAFRGDTYHRITSPFRTADDLLSVVPRLGYHGTFWSRSGKTDLTGAGEPVKDGRITRSIAEGGVTFAGRGTAWVNDTWRHMIEPYTDVLAQKAWYTGLNGENRPYVFDNIDASMAWEDQFAGRGRNLPYSYYGVTPGLRNAWSQLDDRGSLREVLDFDMYAAMSFGKTEFLSNDEMHQLAKVGNPNYGKHALYVTPGARMRWTPSDKTSLSARAEYDSDRHRMAVGAVQWNRQLTSDLSYYVNYGIYDYRYWDFSSCPFRSSQMNEDNYNLVRAHYVTGGFTQQPLECFQWSPYVRWDLRDRELDRVGGWVDLLTDCLGFRFDMQYVNRFTFNTGYVRKEDFSIGFFIYLRAFGPAASNLLVN